MAKISGAALSTFRCVRALLFIAFLHLAAKQPLRNLRSRLKAVVLGRATALPIPVRA